MDSAPALPIAAVHPGRTGRALRLDPWVLGAVVVRPDNSGTALRVTAPPTKVLAVGDAVWLAIDPAQAARIPTEDP